MQQPFPGIYIWRDPHGAFYLVDHTGTRRLPNTRTDEPPEPRRPMIAEFWRTTPFRIELDWSSLASWAS